MSETTKPLDPDLHLALLGDILTELRRIRELLEKLQKKQAAR